MAGVNTVFDPSTVEFLRSGCALIFGTVDADGEPRATRGWGLEPVAGEAHRFRLVVDAYDASLADHVAAGRAIAVTATDVRTLRSLQMKGTIVAVEPATEYDAVVAERYCAGFFGDVHDADGTAIEVLEHLVPPGLAACTFAVAEVFDQAPGPNAGCALGDPAATPPAPPRRVGQPVGDDLHHPAGTDAVEPTPVDDLHVLDLCFEGAVPAVVCTASAAGTPNITYLSRVRRVDDRNVALSNQFFSKTSRNLAENPRASLLLIDPVTYEQYRLRLAYERTERRGRVFDQLRDDVETTAAVQGMQDVFKLRAADVYRVLDVERVASRVLGAEPTAAVRPDRPSEAQRIAALAQLSLRLSRCPDLDTLVETTVAGLAELLGYEHSLLLLLDEEGRRLYTIASHGFDVGGIGSEVAVGEGIIGMAASRCVPMRLGNLRHLHRYSSTVRRAFERDGALAPDEIPVPVLDLAQSRVAVPMVTLGQLVGVLVVESDRPVAFDETDEALLTVVASAVGDAIEIDRTQERGPVAAAPTVGGPATSPTAAGETHVRFFPADGSTFLDGDYLIKGVAGRILWSLLRHHHDEGRVEFTNREVRLDPSLELPELRDNFESRLILLKRRLDEREAPIRITKTGRGRFRLDVATALRLEARA